MIRIFDSAFEDLEFRILDFWILDLWFKFKLLEVASSEQRASSSEQRVASME